MKDVRRPKEEHQININKKKTSERGVSTNGNSNLSTVT